MTSCRRGFAKKQWGINNYKDHSIDSEENGEPRKGFLRLLQLALRTKEDALLHAGPPCSTFVWVNRHTSGRSREDPEGHRWIPGVEAANKPLGQLYNC